MFHSDNPNIITSDEGFSVQILGRTGLRYQQGSHWLRVSSETLATPHGIVIYRSSIKEWVEPQSEPISETARNSILENIRRAFAFRGIEIEII